MIIVECTNPHNIDLNKKGNKGKGEGPGIRYATGRSATGRPQGNQEKDKVWGDHASWRHGGSSSSLGCWDEKSRACARPWKVWGTRPIGFKKAAHQTPGQWPENRKKRVTADTGVEKGTILDARRPGGTAAGVSAKKGTRRATGFEGQSCQSNNYHLKHRPTRQILQQKGAANTSGKSKDSKEKKDQPGRGRIQGNPPQAPKKTGQARKSQEPHKKGQTGRKKKTDAAESLSAPKIKTYRRGGSILLPEQEREGWSRTILGFRRGADAGGEMGAHSFNEDRPRENRSKGKTQQKGRLQKAPSAFAHLHPPPRRRGTRRKTQNDPGAIEHPIDLPRASSARPVDNKTDLNTSGSRGPGRSYFRGEKT